MSQRGSRADSRGAVGAELVAYGHELERAAAAQVGGAFTSDKDANALIESDPNAFLIGVLFTQGIAAERAWAGPYLLRERLGHFDMRRLAEEPASVRDAVQRPPMLHRFKNTLPRWISSAARKVVDDYGGDASRIWESGSHVVDVTERLSAFEGIGRKKSVMATEILMRHFGVELEGRECGQVAYDVQVRRVFLRSGLIDHDSIDAVEAAARRVCPESPGTLDLAAWLIGRETCRPRVPRCDDCRLGRVCPRQTWLSVEGVRSARQAP